jgi:hypothetical protein
MSKPNGKTILTPEQSRRLDRVEELIREVDALHAKHTKQSMDDFTRIRRELFQMLNGGIANSPGVATVPA